MDIKYISAAIIVIVQVAKFFGVDIGSEGFTEWITNGVAFIGGLIIAIKTLKEGKTTIFGGIKKVA